jgi:hypothetical protein
MNLHSRLFLIATILLSFGQFLVTSSVAQSVERGAQFTPISSFQLVAIKRVRTLAHCEAPGTPRCSIDCPMGHAAVCEAGGAFPARCYCQ